MPTTSPELYNQQLRELLATAPMNELGPGTPCEEKQTLLQSLSFTGLLAPHSVEDRGMATCCCAGLWLRFDFLNVAHSLSQSVETREGSYWHAIMHRREPDFGNAKYWFRRVGQHPIYESLQTGARELAGAGNVLREAKFLVEQTSWEPGKFVELCELALDGAPPLHNLCKRVQLCEWELLFEYCYRRAAGLD